MANISKITLGNLTYDIKDTAARTSISNLQTAVTGGMHYIGETSTKLNDLSTTSTLQAKSEGSLSKTSGFVAGDIVIYDNKEFVWSGSLWSEFGSTGSLKKLAFKDSATGSITIPTTNHTHTGTISAYTHSVTLGSVSASGSYTPAGSVTINNKVDNNSKTKDVSTGQHILTENDFASSVSIKGVSGTTNVYSITGVGSTPTLGTAFTVPNITAVGSAPTREAKSVNSITNAGTMFSASVSESDETLTLTSGSAPTYSKVDFYSITGVGSTPTLGTSFKIPNVTGVGSTPTRSAVTVATANSTATTFYPYTADSTANKQTIKDLLSGSFTGTAATVSVSGSTSGVAVAQHNAKNVTTGAPSATASTTITVQ